MFNQFQLYQSIDVKIEEHTTLVSLYQDMQFDPCRVAGVTLSFRSSAGRAALPVCISIDGVENKFHQTKHSPFSNSVPSTRVLRVMKHFIISDIYEIPGGK